MGSTIDSVPTTGPQWPYRFLAPVGWMVVIYLLSTDYMSFPELRRTSAGFVAAKVVHVFEYVVLSLLWYRAVALKLNRWNLAGAVAAVIATSIYAVLDEGHQSLTAYRSGNVEDVILDSSSALVSMLGLWGATRLSAISIKRRGPAVGPSQ